MNDKFFELIGLTQKEAFGPFARHMTDECKERLKQLREDDSLTWIAHKSISTKDYDADLYVIDAGDNVYYAISETRGHIPKLTTRNVDEITPDILKGKFCDMGIISDAASALSQLADKQAENSTLAPILRDAAFAAKKIHFAEKDYTAAHTAFWREHDRAAMRPDTTPARKAACGMKAATPTAE